MKLSPSSSSSSSSYTLSSFNSKSATAGCLTSILRRILCSRGLPTHPCEQIKELDSMYSGKDQEELKGKEKSEVSTPGVVARLMGLESMATTNPLSRSHSMNTVDYMGECCKPMQGLHRRVKSSSYEGPTFHLNENEDFLVLSFESGCEESKEFKKSKGRKKKERVCYVSYVNDGNDGKLENEGIDCEERKLSQKMKAKEVTNGEKVKRRKKRTTCDIEKKVEDECSSEDSSPVSVFDFERQSPRTEVDSFGFDLSWKRKLSPELETQQHFVLHSDSNLMIEGKVEAIENKKDERSQRKVKQRKEYVYIWGEICKLVEDELVGSNQVGAGMSKQGDLESISAEFESEIFDHLLTELIDQLIMNPLKTLQL